MVQKGNAFSKIIMFSINATFLRFFSILCSITSFCMCGIWQNLQETFAISRLQWMVPVFFLPPSKLLNICTGVESTTGFGQRVPKARSFWWGNGFWLCGVGPIYGGFIGSKCLLEKVRHFSWTCFFWMEQELGKHVFSKTSLNRWTKTTTLRIF